MSEPKVHHFVPRFYLRGFANARDQVAVRDREGRSYVTSTRNVMARSGLYTIPGRHSNAEEALSRIETEASRPFKALRSGSLPPLGSPGRSTLAQFMAIQMSRDLDDFAVFFVLAREARKAFGSLPVSKGDMRSLLVERNGFEPNDSEVETARDITNLFGTAPLDEAQMKDMELDIMMDASRKVAPGFEKRTWSLESSKKADLITSDRPVVLWNPPLPQDSYKGVGIEDAEEIWLPVDRKRILILRNSGPSGTRRIGPERVRMVNQHIARHCGKAVVSHPSAADMTARIDLASRRPTHRFSKGPAFDQDTGEKVADEVWHMWRPIRDIPDYEDP